MTAPTLDWMEQVRPKYNPTKKKNRPSPYREEKSNGHVVVGGKGKISRIKRK